MKTTIVIPVYNEKENIINSLTAINNTIIGEFQVIIVFDSDNDNTLPAIKSIEKNLNFKIIYLKNKYGRGALNAIKSGMESADSEYVVITMADLSDPPSVINDMIKKADEENADIVCGSRYMKNGQQKGGPILKSWLSKIAGLSLHYLIGLPTHDPTNSFKLYRKSFLAQNSIESTGGFELGLELVVKAWKNGFKVTEVPSSWIDREHGKSNFQLKKWLPKYLYWYFTALSSNPVHAKTPVNLKKLQRIIVWSILFLAMIWNFFNVCKLSVNVPFWDEWDYLKAVENFNWENLVEVHVQHRIIFTRLLFYWDYLLEGLNFQHLIIFNYFIYLTLIISIMRIFEKQIKDISYFPLFFLPFFTDLASENLIWAGQSQFHLTLLFLMLAIYSGFIAKKTIINNFLFGFFLLLSIFSMTPLLAVCVWGIWLVRQGFIFQKANKSERKKILTESTVLSAVIIAANICFFSNYVQAETGSFRSIWHCAFHICLSLGRTFALLSVDMGYIVWIILLLLFTIPAFFILLTILLQREKIIIHNGGAVAIIGYGITLLFAVTIIRTGCLADRHMEAILPMVPALASILAMQPNYNLRKKSLIAYLIFILITTSFSWTFKKTKINSKERIVGHELLIKWHDSDKKDNLEIPYLYPGDFATQAKIAEKLNISYIKNHKK